MDPRRKVIILYASAGYGHEKAARALLEAYQAGEKDAEVQIYDTLGFTSRFFGRLYGKLYLFLIRWFPWFWGLLYYASDIGWVYLFLKPIRRLMNGGLLRRLETFLAEEDPAVILSTHFMSTEVVSYLKQKKRLQSRLITVVTDYLPHWIWTAPRVDAYVVAIEETKKALVARGVRAEKVHVLGIPVEIKFLRKHSKDELALKLNIKKDVFTLLLTSSGAGIGDTEAIAESILALERPVQMLIVCGMNRNLFARLEWCFKNNERIRVFGFVNNMEELMEVSDVVIGKAGGLTITESFAKGKPVILYQSVPGQEARNVACVLEYQAGYAARSPHEVVKCLKELIGYPEKRKALQIGIRKMSRSEAAAAITKLAEHEIRRK